MTTPRALLVALVVSGSLAHAAPEPPPGAALTSDHSAAAVASAPVPGDESGRTDPIDPGDSGWRELARGALWLPKILLEAAFAPFRGAVWAYDRYKLRDRYYATFYSADHTIALLPTATYQTGLGATIGARFFDVDLLGQGETISAQATYGGAYLNSVSVWLGTGRRLGWIELGIGANRDQRPGDAFYGVGNSDVLPGAAAAASAMTDEELAHLRYREARLAATADARVTDELHVIARGDLTEIELGDGTGGVPIRRVLPVDDLVGFDHPVRHLYGELELRWDSRDRASPWEPLAVHSTGTLARGFAGPVLGLGGAASFWHYGGELQRYVRLAPGPRALALRLHGEAVTAALDELPLSELPTLGGDLLRGYPSQRFRDRVAGFATVQYEWDLSQNLEAYLFVDAGRVFPSLHDLSVDHLRVGYGAGVQLHDAGGFLVEASVASSIDGGIIITAAFSPVLDQRPRWR